MGGVHLVGLEGFVWHQVAQDRDGGIDPLHVELSQAAAHHGDRSWPAWGNAPAVWPPKSCNGDALVDCAGKGRPVPANG